MGIYEDYVLPRLINWACCSSSLERQRAKIVPLATGDVLELGIGTGFNLPHYDTEKVRHLIGIDPSRKGWELAEQKLSETSLEVEFLEASAEQLPLDSDSIDTIVVTYTLCTIPNVIQSLTEARRVLRPDGRLLFCEHGAAPDKNVLRFQKFIQPVWGVCGGGCQLSREIPSIIKESGFKIEELESMYLPGWRFTTYNYWGIARP